MTGSQLVFEIMWHVIDNNKFKTSGKVIWKKNRSVITNGKTLNFLLIIIIIIAIIITFMQGIYTYIPETNYVPREYCVAFVTIHGAYNVSFSVDSVVFLH